MAKEMWQKLQGLYEQKSELSRYNNGDSTIQLYSYIMNQNDNMAIVMPYFKIGKFKQKIKAKMLMSLLENYKHFYSAWGLISNKNETLFNLSF